MCVPAAAVSDVWLTVLRQCYLFLDTYSSFAMHVSSPVKDQALPSHVQVDQRLCSPSHVVCMSLCFLIDE